MAAELSLDQLREEIDKIDEVIVRLLDSRARRAYTVGRLKHQLGRPIYEPAREAAVIAHVRREAVRAHHGRSAADPAHRSGARQGREATKHGHRRANEEHRIDLHTGI
jgi:chorismate mutase / prephenate dehydrogenase